MAKKKSKNEEWITRSETVWIARDKNYKDLFLYTHEPVQATLVDEFTNIEGGCYRISPLWFSDLVFENSPVKVEMKVRMLVPKEGF